MALNPYITQAAGAAALDAIVDLIDVGGTGTLKVYADVQAATADTAVAAQVLCATLTFSATAFGAATTADPSVSTAAAITDDAAADATDTVTWFRILAGGGGAVLDGTCGTSGADINWNTVAFVSGATVSVTALTITEPLN